MHVSLPDGRPPTRRFRDVEVEGERWSLQRVELVESF